MVCLLLQVLRDVADVLEPLAIATELLTTESTPAAGATYYLLHELLAIDLAVVARPESPDDDEDMGETGDSGEVDEPEDRPGDAADGDTEEAEVYDSSLAAKLKSCIASKLMTRFCLDAEGQPDMDVCRTCPLLISSFCDPR